MKKKFGTGSVSLALFILAVLWAVSIKPLDNFCLGDIVLNAIGLQAWSNGSSGTHYTVFYGIAFLIPAIILGYKVPNHLFAKAGRVCSIFLACLLILGSLFMI